MADENKIDNDPKDLENLSPEELQERIKEEKKNARRSLRFAFTALIAIIAVCIAWFAANNQVTMTGTQISAENDQPFEIASVGERQDAEQKFLLDAEGKNILSDGKKENRTQYIDIETGESTDDESHDYYIGGSGVAWRMEGQKNLVPGAGGKLEFYLIPKKTGLTSITVQLNLEGYALNKGSGKERAEKIDNEKIQNLINGHILLFRHHNDEYGYYDWLGENPTLTITAPKREAGEDFVPNIPYKVTLYWKWPQYFRNYIYTQTTTYGDLFTDKMVMDQNYKKQYEDFINFVNDQRDINKSKLFYKQDTTTSSGTSSPSDGSATTITEEINNQMSETVLNTCSSYYNQADEYIGKNTQYIYMQIQVADVNK